MDDHHRALYFSRSPIPYPRDTLGKVDRPSRWLLHLGVYAFRADALLEVTAGTESVSALERAESLEQLRWMAQGWRVAVAVVEHRFWGVDTPDDYAAFARRTAAKREVGCEAG